MSALLGNYISPPYYSHHIHKGCEVFYVYLIISNIRTRNNVNENGESEMKARQRPNKREASHRCAVYSEWNVPIYLWPLRQSQRDMVIILSKGTNTSALKVGKTFSISSTYNKIFMWGFRGELLCNAFEKQKTFL